MYQYNSVSKGKIRPAKLGVEVLGMLIYCNQYYSKQKLGLRAEIRCSSLVDSTDTKCAIILEYTKCNNESTSWMYFHYYT